MGNTYGTDGSHCVVNAARAQSSLDDLKATALTKNHV
jgi:hypothetical protein